MVSPGVVFVPTPPEVGLEMLKLAGVTSNDLVYDLGSGDGRLVIAAALLFGARAVGVELDAKLVQDSREAAAKAGVANRVTFIWGDLFQVDLRPATVVMLYLTADMNLRLRPRLLSELKPGTPVVSHAFDMGEWAPDRAVRVFSADGSRLLNLWIIPARVQGTWAMSVSMPDGELSATTVLEQNFQRVTGVVRTATDAVPIVETSLRGDVIAFSATVAMKPGPRTIRFRGLVAGDSAAGTAEVTGGLASDPGRWTARRLPG
jgi:SAM-dependent methyltransferase